MFPINCLFYNVNYLACLLITTSGSFIGGLGGAGAPQTFSAPSPGICLDDTNFINILIFRVRPRACYMKSTMKRQKSIYSKFIWPAEWSAFMRPHSHSTYLSPPSNSALELPLITTRQIRSDNISMHGSPGFIDGLSICNLLSLSSTFRIGWLLTINTGYHALSMDK